MVKKIALLMMTISSLLSSVICHHHYCHYCEDDDDNDYKNNNDEVFRVLLSWNSLVLASGLDYKKVLCFHKVLGRNAGVESFGDPNGLATRTLLGGMFKNLILCILC